MKKFNICLIFILMLSIVVFAKDDICKIVINADQGEETISRHIYGHFAEHLGGCIYGGFWVGKDSDIPNTRGIRNDIVKALKEIDIPNLRWPGGCFADTYHWRDGVGSMSERKPILNYHWGNITEDNSFGTHEFLDLCELLDCEPYFAGNVGSGTPREMGEWIEYVNSNSKGPMANLRRKNGREEPWNVKFWGVGNEVWGCGGNMDAEYYADVYNRFASYCNSLNGDEFYRIACGPYGEEIEWTETLMKDVKRHLLQGISIHYYTVTYGEWEKRGSATDFSEEQWFGQIRSTLMMEEVIRKNVNIMDRYDPDKEVAMIIDEWGNWHNVEPGTEEGFLFQQNSLRDAMVAAINLNIFNNHCDRVKMANIAQTVNVLQAMILTEEEQIVLTPTYYVFKMFKKHQEAVMLPVYVKSPEYEYGGQSLSAVNVSASKDSEGHIHISLTNADPNQSHKIECDIRGEKVTKVSGEIITADKINAFNDFSEKERVNITEFNDAKIRKDELTVTIPAKSIVMLTVD